MSITNDLLYKTLHYEKTFDESKNYISTSLFGLSSTEYRVGCHLQGSTSSGSFSLYFEIDDKGSYKIESAKYEPSIENSNLSLGFIIRDNVIYIATNSQKLKSISTKLDVLYGTLSGDMMTGNTVSPNGNLIVNFDFASANKLNGLVVTGNYKVSGNASTDVLSVANTTEVSTNMNTNTLTVSGSTETGSLTVSNATSASTLTVNTNATTSVLKVNTNATTNTLNVGSLTKTGSLTVSNATSASTLTVNTNATTNTLNVNTNATTNTLTVNTNATANILNVNTNATVGSLTVSNATSASTLTVNTNATTNTLNVNTNATIGSLTVSNDANVGGTLTVNTNATTNTLNVNSGLSANTISVGTLSINTINAQSASVGVSANINTNKLDVTSTFTANTFNASTVNASGTTNVSSDVTATNLNVNQLNTNLIDINKNTKMIDIEDSNAAITFGDEREVKGIITEAYSNISATSDEIKSLEGLTSTTIAQTLISTDEDVLKRSIRLFNCNKKILSRKCTNDSKSINPVILAMYSKTINPSATSLINKIKTDSETDTISTIFKIDANTYPDLTKYDVEFIPNEDVLNNYAICLLIYVSKYDSEWNPEKVNILYRNGMSGYTMHEDVYINETWEYPVISLTETMVKSNTSSDHNMYVSYYAPAEKESDGSYSRSMAMLSVTINDSGDAGYSLVTGDILKELLNSEGRLISSGAASNLQKNGPFNNNVLYQADEQATLMVNSVPSTNKFTSIDTEVNSTYILTQSSNFDAPKYSLRVARRTEVNNDNLRKSEGDYEERLPTVGYIQRLLREFEALNYRGSITTSTTPSTSGSKKYYEIAAVNKDTSLIGDFYIYSGDNTQTYGYFDSNSATGIGYICNGDIVIVNNISSGNPVYRILRLNRLISNELAPAYVNKNNGSGNLAVVTSNKTYTYKNPETGSNENISYEIRKTDISIDDSNNITGISKATINNIETKEINAVDSTGLKIKPVTTFAGNASFSEKLTAVKGVTTDNIYEATSNKGVDIDGILIKDSTITGVSDITGTNLIFTNGTITSGLTASTITATSTLTAPAATIKGNMTLDGSISSDGDISTESNITASGNITSSETLTAKSIVEGGTELSSKYLGIDAEASSATVAVSLSVNAAIGSATKPVYFTSDGIPSVVSSTLDVCINGNASTADKLNSNDGSATLPIYFYGGKPVATSTTLDVCINGNASTATDATKIKTSKTSANEVYLLGTTSKENDSSVTPVFNTQFKYNANSDTLNVGNISVSGSIGSDTASVITNSLKASSATINGVLTTTDLVVKGNFTTEATTESVVFVDDPVIELGAIRDKDGNIAPNTSNEIGIYSHILKGSSNNGIYKIAVIPSSHSENLGSLPSGGYYGVSSSTDLKINVYDKNNNSKGYLVYNISSNAISVSNNIQSNPDIKPIYPVRGFFVNNDGISKVGIAFAYEAGKDANDKIYTNLVKTSWIYDDITQPILTKDEDLTEGILVYNPAKKRAEKLQNIDSSKGNGLSINGTSITMNKASASIYGTVKVTNENGLNIDDNGTISMSKVTTNGAIGALGIRSGQNNIQIDDSGYISLNTSLTGIDTTGNAASADKLNSNAGSATLPIYFSGGKPVAITGAIENDITGNAKTAYGKEESALNVATAGTLTTYRNFSITGGATAAAVSFNGSSGVALEVTSIKPAVIASGTIGSEKNTVDLIGNASSASVAQKILTYNITSGNADAFNENLKILFRNTDNSLETSQATLFTGAVKPLTFNPKTGVVTAEKFNGQFEVKDIGVSDKPSNVSNVYFFDVLLSDKYSASIGRNYTHTSINVASSYKFYYNSSNGYVYANGFSATSNIIASGTISACVFNATSDKRLKTDILPWPETISASELINKINIYEYKFKSDKNKEKHIGVIAQELQELDINGFNFVSENEDGYLSVKEGKLVYLLIKAVQEQNKKIEELEEKLNKVLKE